MPEKKQESKLKSTILMLVLLPIVTLTVYISLDYVRYKVERKQFQKVIDQCVSRTRELHGSYTSGNMSKAEYNSLIEKCVQESSKNPKYHLVLEDNKPD